MARPSMGQCETNSESFRTSSTSSISASNPPSFVLFQAHARLFDGRVAQQFPSAAVPQHDAARPVIAGRNVALEFAVFERMILHLRGQEFGERFERRAFGNRSEAR